jgi:hypothetical protein
MLKSSFLIVLISMMFFSFSFVAMFAHAVSTNMPLGNQSKAISKSPGAYQGQYVKIFAIKNFENQNQWKQIDIYASQGYEIKAVLSKMNYYIVIMEKNVPGT